MRECNEEAGSKGRGHDQEHHPRASNWRRGEYVREHHFELTHGHDRHFARDGGDRRRVYYYDQQFVNGVDQLRHYHGI